MRKYAWTALAALFLAAPPPAAGQDGIPRDLARRLERLLADDDTERHEGDTRIRRGRSVDGNVAVTDGDLELDGRVDGDVVVINGDLELGEDAEITGDVTVIGGGITGEDEARLGGDVLVYSESVALCEVGGRVRLGDACGDAADDDEDVDDGDEDDVDVNIDVEAGDDDDDDRDRDRDRWENRRRYGHASFDVSAGRSYNRVEGLPIRLGPSIETAGDNPFRIRAHAIFRTEEGHEAEGHDRWGYDARAEQLFGNRQFRIGGRLYSVVDPIEDWHLTDLENSLSTFFLHNDYRDHYEREGWSVYGRLAPRGSALDATVEYRQESHRSLATGSPWALFNNAEEWRPQPLIGEGDLSSVVGVLVLDSRSSRRDPSSGWYVRGELEQALDAELTRATAMPYDPEGSSIPDPIAPVSYDDFMRGLIDIRRYNRVSPSSRLNFRLSAGGALTGNPLPPQRQFALGGEGTLPGYSLFTFDCGARDLAYTRGTAFPQSGRPTYFPAYGCDRFGLFQAEYRGEINFHFYVNRWDDDEEDEDEDWSDAWSGVDTDIGWVFFVDAGRAWNVGEAADGATAVDVGAGILLGELGLYLAVPVGAHEHRGGVNFFIRLAPRF
ncbi:MAG TPA: polymer-forming cytoskeletal protein [Longimicrobium sp.]|nr:polymer-forming cytoskeletal protein [Longimicrobium sp.]